jgi:hypothetical protein
MSHVHAEDCSCCDHSIKTEELKIERRNDEELKELANDLVHGRIFCNLHLQGDDVKMLPKIFLPLSFGAISALSDEKQKQIGMLFEYVDKDVNEVDHAFPIFLTVQALHMDDMSKFMDYGRKDFSKRDNS